MKVPFLIIGSGLSGLAAAIRFARFFPDVLLLEKHTKLGGLNSYYYRNKTLIETGLHAITNYAPTHKKNTPLNKLFRQLKLHRKSFSLHEQIQSEIYFVGNTSLKFSNDFNLLKSEIEHHFPQSFPGFLQCLKAIDSYDPFTPKTFISAKIFLENFIKEPLLIDMLLCPLFYYGSSLEDDMDMDQFVIMFRAIYQEGMFRPEGTIKEFLDSLLKHYTSFGGELRLKSKVTKILSHNNSVSGVELESGEIIYCDYLLSTIGYEETMDLLSMPKDTSETHRLGFVESIFQLPISLQADYPLDKTIIFYNKPSSFTYKRPDDLISLENGVICFPSNFQGIPEGDYFQIRTTHLANFQAWKNISTDKSQYHLTKEKITKEIRINLKKIIGNFHENVVYEDTFTPLTIERYTAKKEGAIYGNPKKFKDGELGYTNLFLAGTDQGLLGIIGSMLSGVTMVNKHILPKF